MLNFFAKRKLSRQLSEYLDSEAVQKLLDGSALDTPKIQSGRFEFVFVFVRADSPEQLAERIGLVADAGIEHRSIQTISQSRPASSCPATSGGTVTYAS